MEEFPLKERLIDAMERCFDRKGLKKTTLGEVAKEAGVSRMTVYRQFKDRQALFAAAALRNMHRQWERINQELGTMETIDDWLLQAMLHFHRMSANDEKVMLYSRIGGHELGLEVALSEPGLAAVTPYFSHLFAKAERENLLLRGVVIEDIVEWIHRTNYSLIVHPSARLRDEEDRRRWLNMQIQGMLCRDATGSV